VIFINPAVCVDLSLQWLHSYWGIKHYIMR